MNHQTTRWLRTATVLTVTALTSLSTPAAHAQDQLWITQFGTSEVDIAQALTPDGAGGVMVAGHTLGSLGGPWAGYGGDAFLARYDGEGNQLWMRQFGSRQWEDSLALSPDGAGGVMIAGTTWGSLARPNTSRKSEPFLARYDSAGNQLWIRQFGTSARDHANALAPDGARGVIIAGQAGDNLGGPNAGRGDAFLARFNSQGRQIWIRQFGSSEGDHAYALAPDGAGGVIVAGATQGNLGGRNAGDTDVFLAHFSHGGRQVWIRQFGSRESDLAYALAPDGAGGVIVAGFTLGSLGGPYAGGGDVFVARHDAEGNQLWIRQFGTTGTEQAFALAPDGAGGVLVAGHIEGTPNPPHSGEYNAFLARYDGAGNQLWIRLFGTSSDDGARALAPDGVGGVMVAGFTWGNLGGPIAGSADAFLARYAIESCYADCDQSTGLGVLDMLDFLCFQNSFVAGEPYACDCDPDPACNIFDFLCFQNAFVSGCP